ncbi:MAG: choice-of-anchor B family protein [Lewinellaceae bacterium]|nr:choice-of-anchor B family protein [Phaeodactylibacter sp.]MCB9041422.1 choice-of-anchor B family protein [Lewinellaceae bacterium]
MKKTLLLLLFAAFCLNGKAQLNMSLLSQVSYSQSLNDVWGWADPETGVEYALVGLRNGVSIVSLENPSDAQEVAFVPGPNSTWRDIKAWGHFAYVTNETSNGLLVIDMSGLPDNVSYIEWTPNLPGLGELSSCHNLYIDEFGYCYLAGCNLNAGGMLILNVDTADGTPQFINAGPGIYAHDVYAKSNKMYASEIYSGNMAIYDVANKNSIQLLATQQTPFSFTHNIWVNDEETVAFTTDERGDAPVAAYDISDLNNIEELDQYRPVGTLGQSVIPHNVHVWDNYLLISYYTDGGRVVDASRPTNLIEVGNYDTWLGGNGGFDGAWGLYPFLPSQTVLVTDINNGLYVLQPTFVRACWLEGIVTDSITGAFLNGVEVLIDSEQPNLGTTDPFGKFETGQAISGTFNVAFTKPGYKEKTIEVALENGVLTEVQVELAPISSFALSGKAIRNADGLPVPGAKVLAVGDILSYEATTDAAGNFSLPEVVEDTYTIYAGAWGYRYAQLDGVNLSGNTTVTIQLEEGYQDDFFFDYGWTTGDDGATAGFWELGEPIPTTYQGSFVSPDGDYPSDLGTECYTTGIGGGQPGNFDVDEGTVYLYSPIMDLSGYENPVFTGRFWFYNGGPFGAPNDYFSISVTNGTDEVELYNTTSSLSFWRPINDIKLVEYIALTDNMQLIFETKDDAANGNWVEAAVDQILVEEGEPLSGLDDLSASSSVKVFPNPFGQAATLSYQLPESAGSALLLVYNAFGQEVQRMELLNQQGQVQLGQNLANGIYWVKLEAGGQLVETVKMVKAN